MKTILSIDGGGIRGIIPAKILDHLEKVIGVRTCEMFDMIAGTSTGGILALALVRPNPHNEEVPCYAATDLVRLYSERGDDIFSRSLWKRVSSAGGIVDERYPSEAIESILHEYFGVTLIEEALTNALVTTYDIEERTPFIFKSWDMHKSGYLMKDAARATSAAPTYFEPALVYSIDKESVPLIDGGVYVNNPAMCAYAEAKRLWPDEDRIVVVSLGTGELIRPIAYEEARSWGLVEWVAPLISVVFDGQSDAVDYQLRQILRADYFRIQGRLEIASDDMDNATKANIEALKEEAYRIRSQNEGDLAEICSILRKRRG